MSGWERENRTHFDEITELYDKARPDYPDELIQDTLNYIRAENGMKALEIGAGTGKATEPFLRAGIDVSAIEIGKNMTEYLQTKFSGYYGFKAVNASFENADIENGSFDFIYAASSFHWVDAEVGCPKMMRALKNGGAVALLRYNFIPPVGKKIFDEIAKVYEKHYYSHYKDNARPRVKSAEEFASAAGIQSGYGFESLEKYGFCDVMMKFYPVMLAYSASEYINFLKTMSDLRKLPEEKNRSLYAEVYEIILSNGDKYENECMYQAYMGRKPE